MEQFDLNWHTFSDHVKEMMQNLLLSNESTDITLICEDKTKFKAHKFVLNACSPLFQTIINDLPQKGPCYLSKRSPCSRNEINFTVHVSWKSNILSEQNESIP